MKPQTQFESCFRFVFNSQKSVLNFDIDFKGMDFKDKDEPSDTDNQTDNF